MQEAPSRNHASSQLEDQLANRYNSCAFQKLPEAHAKNPHVAKGAIRSPFGGLPKVTLTLPTAHSLFRLAFLALVILGGCSRRNASSVATSHSTDAETPIAGSLPVTAADKADPSAVVRQYLAACVSKDRDLAQSFWLADSPHLPRRLNELDSLWRRGQLTFPNPKTTITQNESDHAHVSTEVQAVFATANKTIAFLFAREFTLRLSEGTWQIWNDVSSYDTFADSLLSESGAKRRTEMLAAKDAQFREHLADQLIDTIIPQARTDNRRQKQLFDVVFDIARGLSDDRRLAEAHNLLAVVCEHRRDPKGADTNYGAAIAFAQKCDESLTARLLRNRCAFYRTQANYAHALSDAHRALEIDRRGKDNLGECQTLFELAQVYFRRKDLRVAWRHHEQSQTIATNLLRTLSQESHDDPDLERIRITSAGNLNGLGGIALLQGNYQVASTFFAAAVELAHQTQDRSLQTAMQGNLGLCYLLLGDKDLALASELRAMKTAKKVGSGQQLAFRHLALGTTYDAIGRRDEAIREYDAVIPLARRGGYARLEFNALYARAAAYFDKHQPEEARSCLEAAERLAAQNEGSGSWSLWRLAALRARLARNANQIADAERKLREAIADIERTRARTVGAFELAYAYFHDSRATPYYELTDLLLSTGRFDEGIRCLELVRSRMLLDMLHQRNEGSFFHCSVADRKRLSDLTHRIATLQLERQNDQSHARRTEIADALTECESQLTRLRAECDARADRPSAERAKEINAYVDEVSGWLDDKTAVIDYCIAATGTWAVVVRRPAANGAAPIQMAYRLPAASEVDLHQPIADLRSAMRRPGGYLEPSRHLYKLLIEPLTSEFHGVERLIILADGILWTVPFAALQNEKREFLIERFAISYAPSLAYLGNQSQIRRLGKSADRANSDVLGFLGVVNPLLDRSTQAMYGKRLSDLANHEPTMARIADLYAKNVPRQTYAGPDATEHSIRADLPRARAVLFACHGVLSGKAPLDSALLLSSPTLNDQGPGEDGRLEGWEVLTMNLASLDVAVLAACHTQEGKVTKGEGIIGLGWAFLRAGCPTVVCSQWDVPSTETSLLVEEFFRQRIANRLNIAAALQAAQKTMMRRTGGRHPGTWAGFIALGM